MKIEIILGSTRPNRKSEFVGKWVLENAPKENDVEFELVDLRDYPLPFYDEAASPLALKGKYQTPGAKDWAAKIAEADSFIFITPEYNHGYPAVLKNALDYVYYEWNNKPVAFVSYGNIAGGARSVMQLVQVVHELQMHPVREAVHLPFLYFNIDEQGKFKQGYHVPDLQPMYTSLLWWTKVLKEARAKKEVEEVA